MSAPWCFALTARFGGLGSTVIREKKQRFEVIRGGARYLVVSFTGYLVLHTIPTHGTL